DCLTDCDTEHHSPSYSLDKSTEAPERVAPGSTFTYTLTVRNTSSAKVEGFSVTDDLAGLTHVEDARVGGSPIPACDAAPVCLDGTDLRWSFPTLQPQGQDGDSATLTYTVKVKADAFGVDIDNLATPGPGGECIEGEDPECTTHHETKDKPRLTLVKDVDNGTTDGTAAPKDFTLSATPVDVPDAGSQAQGVVSGPGGGAGQVKERAVLPGDYELDETHVDHYTQGLWECRPTAVPGDWTAAGDLGGKGTVELALDEDVTCRVTNTADGGKYSIAKSSDQDGEEVLPGSEIVYTLTARWVDGVRMEDVVVRDEVTDVIDDADLDESDLPANAVLVTEGDRTFIEWTIPLLEDSDGNRQATLTYSVTVNADAWSTTLRNVVTPVTEDGTCEEGNDCETTTTTPDLPKLALVKEMEQGVGTPTAVETDWILSADPDAQVGGGQGAESGAGGFGSRPVWPGTYALDESDSPGSDGAVGDYSAGDWSCVDNTTQQQAAFGGLDGADLELAPNDDVTCTIVNTRDPRWAVGKTNDRGDGTTVLPGQEVAYTLTVHHTVGVKPTGIVVHDDLSDVLDDATMVTTFPAAGGAVTFDEGTQVLTWNVPAFEGDSTEQSFTYVVRVRDDAAGVTLVNAVTSPGSNCPPALSLAAVLTEEDVAQLDCSTSNPVPAWTLDKGSEPLSGEFVEGGDEITYSLVVTNTSDAVLEGATVVDDLSAVLGNAALAEDSFLVDGVAPAAGEAVFDDAADTLTWQVPTIAPGGAPVELTYVVRVDDELEPGTFFENVAAPGDPANPVNSTGRCVAEGECTTHHGTQEVVPPVEPPTEPPTGNPPADPPSSTVAGPLPPSDGFLPSTGGPARWLVPGAVALLLAGLALVLLERRRRRVD
ncbi:MAG TPA: hypothetical protein VFJ28_04215, partial [Marmoricola sp.]|nr:hypothetical protein [Marmoricola sp.]